MSAATGAPVNLAEVQAARARLASLVAAHPEIRERTAAFLESNPTSAELDSLMEQDVDDTKNLAVRLPLDLLDRLDRYVDAQKVEDPGTSYSRSDAMRRLLYKGLAAWEAEQAARERGTFLAALPPEQFAAARGAIKKQAAAAKGKAKPKGKQP